MHCVNEHPNCLPPGKIALPLTSISIQTFAIVRSLFKYNHRMVNANLANSVDGKRYFARVQNEIWTIGVQLSAKLLTTNEENLVEAGRSY